MNEFITQFTQNRQINDRHPPLILFKTLKIRVNFLFIPSQVPQPKKLTFLYLANDVIQNSKKKGPEFSMEFEGKFVIIVTISTL